MSDLKNRKREIRSFGDLPAGWHFGEGVGADKTTVDTALDIYALMNDKEIENIEVFPAIDGGILISGYFENEALDVSCRPDGTMELDYEVDQALEDEKQGLNLNDVRAYLEELNWSRKKLYGYCILNISANKDEGSQVRLFRILVEKKGSRYSVQNVPAKSVETSAVILPDTMEISQNFLSFFGESNPDTYQVTPISLKSHQQRGTLVTVTSGGWGEVGVRA